MKMGKMLEKKKKKMLGKKWKVDDGELPVKTDKLFLLMRHSLKMGMW